MRMGAGDHLFKEAVQLLVCSLQDQDSASVRVSSRASVEVINISVILLLKL
jgi:uncharacterized protein (UPF0548 family)